MEMASGVVPVAKRMRIGYAPHEGNPPLPELHIGYEVSVFREAHRPWSTKMKVHSTVVISWRDRASVLGRLHYGGRAILLPGDAEKEVEYTSPAECTRFSARGCIKSGTPRKHKLEQDSWMR